MIEVADVSFTYHRSNTPAVRGLDFKIEPGEIFGFLGPSGAGKSTTQKILIGLLRGYEGRASVLGKDVADWRADDYERIGVSFESPTHFQKLTGLENLRYFAALYAGKCRAPADLLEEVGLDGDGDQRVGEYSKGMKGRLSVARALLHEPSLLFMDEPTVGLDPTNARGIKELIRVQRDAGRTVFLSTHDMTVADELCDRVAFIVDGEIRCIESPQTLKLEHGERSVRVELASPNGATEHEDFPLDGLADNAEFLARLRDERLQTVHSREASLAEVFIKVTGRDLG
jgi:fluoroquinolone transport system ATP-binding protein